MAPEDDLNEVSSCYKDKLIIGLGITGNIKKLQTSPAASFNISKHLGGLIPYPVSYPPFFADV